MIATRLRQWLESQNLTEPGILRQWEPTKTVVKKGICGEIHPDTVEEMLDIAEESADVFLEKGSPIYSDLTLGPIYTGSAFGVAVPRTHNVIGTFHCHPFGVQIPSPDDIAEVMVHDDKVSCIGRGGYIKTRLTCYAPVKDALWNEIRDRIEKARLSLAIFVDQMRTKHPKWKMKTLRRYLRWHDMENWEKLDNLEWELSKSVRAAEKLTYPKRKYEPDCSWIRDTHMYIRGGAIEEEEEYGERVSKSNPAAKEPKRYEYTWTLPGGEKRFTSSAYGDSWPDALINIQRYHPKRSNISRLGGEPEAELPKAEAGVAKEMPKPMTFNQVRESIRKELSSQGIWDEATIMQRAQSEVLEGYRSISETLEDVATMRFTGNVRFTARGYEINADTIEQALLARGDIKAIPKAEAGKPEAR